MPTFFRKRDTSSTLLKVGAAGSPREKSEFMKNVENRPHKPAQIISKSVFTRVDKRTRKGRRYDSRLDRRGVK